MMKKGCGCIIYNDEGKILLGLRCKKEDKAEWCLPGGQIEEDESPVQGVTRESYEEAGIVITEPRRLLMTANYDTGWCDFVYEVRKWYGKPKAQPEEFSKIAWVTFEEAKKLQLYSATAAALSALKLI